MEKHYFFKLAALFVLTCALSADAAILSPDGRVYKQIVLEGGQPASVQLAATELQHFLKEISGDELPIVQEPSEKPFIIVGANKILKARGLDGNDLKPEGWAFKTTEDFLALYGQDYGGPLLFGPINPWRYVEAYNDEIKLNAFGASGTLSAVYEFLHRKAGVRFYMSGPDGTVVPKQNEFRVPELDETGAPQVSWRWIWMCFLSNNKDVALWSKRLGIGGKAPVMIIHTYRNFQKYKDKHPEYFALANGKRAFTSECVADGHGHLCLTNPDVIQQWADDICDYFDKNPDVEVYPLGPNDGLNKICECENCQSDLDPEIGGNEKFSLHIWKFTAKVAEKVAEKHPDKYVGCLAYERYRTPPRSMSNMKNVAVMFCNWRSMAANPETRASLHKEIETWSSRVDRFYLWSWYLDHWMPWTYLPVVQMKNIQRELSWLYNDPKFSGEFIESEAQNGGGNNYRTLQCPGMMHLNLYMTGRMYMEPASDADQILEEYAKLFYGPAEKPMLEFWRTAQDTREAYYATHKEATPDQLFTAPLLAKMQGMLNDAVAAVEPDSVWHRRIAVVKGEFDQGAARLIRLDAVGKQKFTTPIVDDFSDFNSMEGMKFTGRGGEVTSPATWMFAGRDRQFLYLRFICFENDMSSLREKVNANDDGSSWLDDGIELFFYPNENDLKNGYQLILTTNGSLFDKTCTGVLTGDKTWSSEAITKIIKEDNRWIAEIKIPFTAIGIHDPNFAGNIITNVYRNRTREAGHTSSCWSPTGQWAHNCPDAFGILRLH